MGTVRITKEDLREIEEKGYVEIEITEEVLADGALPTPTSMRMVSNLGETARARIAILYPGEETFVEREFIKMQIWLEANQRKAPKSKAGWTRFIMGWLERSWERYRKMIPGAKTDDWGKVFE